MLPLAAALTLLSVLSAGAVDYSATILADHPIAYYRLEETKRLQSRPTAAPRDFYQEPMRTTTSITTPTFLFWVGLASKPTRSRYPPHAGLTLYPFLIIPNSINPARSHLRFGPARSACQPVAITVVRIGNSPAFGPATTQSGWYVYQTPDVPSEFALVTPTGDVFIQTTNYTLFNWYHLAGTYDGTNMSFYVNGALIGTQKASSYVANSVNNANGCVFALGQRGDGYGNFDGQLDEAAFLTAMP